MMVMCSKIIWLQIGATLILYMIGDIGDHITTQPLIRNCPVSLALIDNSIHGIIGLLSWVVVDPSSILSPTIELLSVILGSSMIDIDHFLAARSFQLSHVLHAPHRGILHCSSLLLLIALLLLPFNFNWSIILLVIFIPHHLRDSTRRGLYLYFPYVHSQPTSKTVVRILLVIFPWIILLIRTKYLAYSVNSSIGKSLFRQNIRNSSDTFII